MDKETHTTTHRGMHTSTTKLVGWLCHSLDPAGAFCESRRCTARGSIGRRRPCIYRIEARHARSTYSLHVTNVQRRSLRMHARTYVPRVRMSTCFPRKACMVSFKLGFPHAAYIGQWILLVCCLAVCHHLDGAIDLAHTPFFIETGSPGSADDHPGILLYVGIHVYIYD